MSFEKLAKKCIELASQTIRRLIILEDNPYGDFARPAVSTSCHKIL